MAAVYSVNEALGANNNVFYSMWRLYQQMKLAGWTVWGSSNGTSFSTSGTDHWSTSFASGPENNGAWLAFTQPGIGADLRGVCFQTVTVSPRRYRILYTTTGWASGGASVTVAPLAVGTTHYALGSSGAGVDALFCASPPTVKWLNIICRDAATDGGVTLHGFDAGFCNSYFCISQVFARMSQGPMDGYLIAAGAYAVGGYPAAWTQMFKAVAEDGVLKTCVGALMRDEDALGASLGVWLDISDQRDGYVGASVWVLQNPYYRIKDAPRSPLGACKELVMRPLNSNWDFYGGSGSAGYDWVRSDVQACCLPWDGVTTTINRS